MAAILVAVGAVVLFTEDVNADPKGSCKHEHWHENHGPFSHWNVSGPFDVQGRLVGASTYQKPGYQKWTNGPVGLRWLWVKFETRTIQTTVRVNQSTNVNTIEQVRAKYPASAGYSVWAIRSYGGNHAYEGNQHINNGLTHSIGHIEEDKHGNHQHCWR